MDEMPVSQASAAARLALQSWSNTALERRNEIACAFAEALKRTKPELSLIISEETGKPRWESTAEVDAMIGKVALSIRAIEERRRSTETTADGLTSATRYKPHGVVAVLGPFNFPGHLPNGHIVPALLAGNTVIFKPSEHTPRIGRRMAALWTDAGLPEGALSIVEGGPEVGEALVASDIDGVFFTGSFAVGRAINRALADHPGKIAALEMGGNNPLIVHNAQDLKAAAYLTIQSAYLTAGQRCSCARRLILIDGADTRRFLEVLTEMIFRIRVGYHIDTPEPFMGPVISEAAARKILSQVESLDGDARASDGILAPKSLRDDIRLLRPGLIDVTRSTTRSDEEIFGPVLQVIRVKDFDSAIAEGNDTRFGLAAGLLSDDPALWDKFYREIRAGVVNWNRPLTGASSALPFGGIGDSGNHRPSAFFAADYCSYPVATMQSDRVAMPKQLSPGIDL